MDPEHGMQMLGMVFMTFGIILSLACTPTDPDGSIFGGNMGDNYYCMPGPPSTTFAGQDDGSSTVLFCDEQLDNSTFDAACDNSLYLRTPESVSGSTFTKANVIPGRNCRPDPVFTQEGTFSNLSDFANQLGEEPCNCHAFNIRLARNPDEDVSSPKSREVLATQKIKAFTADTPCAFREASYAWDVMGDETQFTDSTVLSMNANKQGIVHPLKFDPVDVKFRNNDFQNDTEACDPLNAPVCGNTSDVSINELINFCFVDPSLGLNEETNTFVTQDQVDALAETCNSVSADDFDGSISPIVRECCMKATLPGTDASSSGVFIRRDLLLAAGCRSTTHSRNNGDGKMHRPKDKVDLNVYHGQYTHSGPPPFNFDYSSDLLSPLRSSSAANGVNRICLLPEAFEELSGAECALITQRNTEDEVPDKTRTPVDFGDTSGQTSSESWQCESCIVPRFFIDGTLTDTVLPADDMLRLFGMYSRSTTMATDSNSADYTLPLYYNILANAMRGSESFEVLSNEKVINTLSSMTPSQYLFAGGLVFSRHFWKFDYGDMFGDDYDDKDVLETGRTFYARACETQGNPYEDVDKTVPPNFCLGGRDFLQTSWCAGVRTQNNEVPFTDKEASLIDAYVLKMSRGRYDALTDKAILVVKRCYKKYPLAFDKAATCVQEATNEFVKRANTCDGMPTNEGVAFNGKGPNPGKHCKASQPPQRNPYLYTEEPIEMPPQQYIFPCEIDATSNDIIFKESAPKLTGFYHPLFYMGISEQITSVNTKPPLNSESHPTERFPNNIGSPNTVTTEGLQPTLAGNNGDIRAFYSVSDAYTEVYDNEEIYIFNNYCEENQFVQALKGYPGFFLSSGADYRFDASRDGCSDAVKRGRMPAYNFLNTEHETPGCKKTISTVPQTGDSARHYSVVSPLTQPSIKYMHIKSLLSPDKMAGDILKPVGEGILAVGSVALAVATGGGSAAAEAAAEAATETTAAVAAEAATDAAAEAVATESAAAATFNPDVDFDADFIFGDSEAAGEEAGEAAEASEDSDALKSAKKAQKAALKAAQKAKSSIISRVAKSVFLIGAGAHFTDETVNSALEAIDPKPLTVPIPPSPTFGALEPGGINAPDPSSNVKTIMNVLQNQDANILGAVVAKIQRTNGLDASGALPFKAYIVSEVASQISSDILTQEHNADLNYVTVYGPFENAVINSFLTNISYFGKSPSDRSCGGGAYTLQANSDGSTFKYVNNKITMPDGSTFSVDEIDANDRGTEFSGSGIDLLPDAIAFEQVGKYEWHPYLSRMTPATNWHNRIPSFMNGHFSDSTFSPGQDGDWKNVLGTFPSLKVGTSMYCSAVLGTEKPQNVVAGKRRLRVYEAENIPGDGRTNPSIYTRVNFDDITGNVYRMRNPDDFSSVFGSYSRSVNQDPLDGITPAMAQRCNLCSAYGAPLQYSPRDDSCKTNTNKFLRYDLTESLHDKHFKEFVENKNLQFLQFEFSNFNLSAGNPDQLDLVEQLLGMTLQGEALPYEKRPCSGNVQTMPAGVPGICELKANLFALEQDKRGLKCPVQTANYGARCLNPFWLNNERIIWPAQTTGFDKNALTPNYCFNAFPGIESGDAYQPKYDKDNNFVGWKPPPFDPDSTRYVFCLNDNLESQARDRFCKQGGYRGYLGYTIGEWSDPAKICTRFVAGARRLCIWFPDNPSLSLQSLIDNAPTAGGKSNEEPMKVTIYIVPVSWKVARLVWGYATVSDLSFYNINNAPGTEYTPYDKHDITTLGPFQALKLPYKDSGEYLNGFCNVNVFSGGDEATLRTSFAKLLTAVTQMETPAGSGTYTVPIFDEPSTIATSNIKFTATMTEDEVFPAIVTGPLQIAEHEIHLESAFSFVTLSKAQMDPGITRAVHLARFKPKSQSLCTIIEVGYPGFGAFALEFDMSECVAEPYLRTPIVFSSRDVSRATVSEIVVIDAPTATLWKGNDMFDGFSRSDGWTLKVTGSIVQNILFKQTKAPTETTQGVLAGAARTIDALGVYQCELNQYGCNSLAVHYPGSIADHTEDDDAPQERVFACDSVPKAFDNETDALAALDEALSMTTTTTTATTTTTTTTTATLPPGQVANRFDAGDSSIYIDNGVSLSAVIADSKDAWSNSLSTWDVYYGGEFNPPIIQTTPNLAQPRLGGLCSDDNCTTSNMSERWWLAKTTDSPGPRVVRCSGKGCIGGTTGCTEECHGTPTAFETYGIIQDWKLVSQGENTVKLCALANPSLCSTTVYEVTSNDEIAYDGANFRDGVFALSFVDNPGLCLDRSNVSHPMPCDVLDLNQRFALGHGQHGRLESDDPYACLSAFAHEPDKMWTQTCFPCQVSDMAHRKCTDNQSMSIFPTASPPDWLEGEMAVGVPVSKTHSVAVQVYTGKCADHGFTSARRCRPECSVGSSASVCDSPLGVGVSMCVGQNVVGPLASVLGSDVGALLFDKPTILAITGQSSKGKARALSVNSKVIVFESDTTFIDKEFLSVDPSVGTNPVLRASVARAIFQPIDEVADFQVSQLALTNVTEIIDRFGATVLTTYAEQFEDSPLLWQVLIAIFSVVLFGLLVLHISLTYAEEVKLAEEDEELEKKKQ